MRGLRHALHPDSRRALEDVRTRGRKAIVLVNRRGWSAFVECRDCGRDVDVPALRRDAHAPPRGHTCTPRVPPLRSLRARRAVVPRLRIDGGLTPRRRHAARRVRAARGTGAAARLPPGRGRRAAQARHRRDAGRLRRAPTRACWSARRWSRRATTSPRSSWRSCRTRTRPCAFPTSVRRSAPSRSCRSWPGAAAAARRGGRVLVQTLSPDTACLRHAAQHDAEGFLAEEMERRRALALPALLHPDRRDRSRARPRGGRSHGGTGGGAAGRARRARAGAAVPAEGPATAPAWS